MKAVVCGIVNGGVEDAIELDEAAGFVEFILHAGPKGDLDYAVEFLRKFVAREFTSCPGVDHRLLEIPSSG